MICTVGRGEGASRVSLPAHPKSAAAARKFILQFLTDVGRDDLGEDAGLLVSELVTNALVHAGTQIDISAEIHGGRTLWVGVSDGSSHGPVPQDHGVLAANGRGLNLVESLVDEWGVDASEVGKTVWFKLGSPENKKRLVEPATLGRPLRRTSAATFQVELLDVPLLLHMAWQVHIEALLREYLLVQMRPDTAPKEIEDHAAAHDAKALLQEQIPSHTLPDEPNALLTRSADPEARHSRVILEIPRASVHNFRILEGRIEAALYLADAGSLLTPPTQPEVRMLRRWLCEEVLSQYEGAVPRPWSAGDLPAPLYRSALVWDRSLLEGTHIATVAADDANRIVALNSQALSLLGYVNS